MKIIYLHQYFNTPNTHGSTRSFELAIRLVRDGHDVHMITSQQDNKKNKNHFSIENGIKVYWLPVLYSHKMGFYKRIIVFINFSILAIKQCLKINSDLIIASSTPLTITIPAIILKKIKNIPMVFEVRDLWPLIPIAMGELKNSLLKGFAKKLESYSYLVSEKIIVLSSDMKKYLIKKGIESKKIVTIPNFGSLKVDNENLDHKELNKVLKMIGDSPFILYAGAIGKVNGMSYLVDIAYETLKINKNVKFLMAGKGKEKSHIIKYSKQLNVLGNNLFIVNPISKKELPYLINRATLVSSFTIPIEELNYNSANKFFDGLSAGKPVMINYGGWQKTLLEKERAGIVIPEDNSVKASGIINNFIIDEKKIFQYGKSAQKISLDYFSIDVLYKKFVDTLNTVLINHD
ncbi:MAG: glycosyltransferase family 4 protein [Candidatus Marinimicrobia bacterium]|jgi:glycosyltransferase involved in cell wall biosynthesis|nr:glycosyltransferase family 4 protein [Candidatus Neomarinimicrobiota bacterium]|tara:strand:- start:2062 stop:3273 length:1212 start_codon:yes stop_codon:yes gene_type:complete